MSIYARSVRLGQDVEHELAGYRRGVEALLEADQVDAVGDKVANHLRRQRRLPDPTLFRHVSPLGWQHIVLTGDYD